MTAGGRKLVIQIPCSNEAETLPATLTDLPREVDGIDSVEWLVVDDSSTDRSAEVARRLGVDHVVRHDTTRGLAAAFLTGLDAALENGADIVVNTDADNQYDGSCITDLVRPIVERRADLVVGERPIETINECSSMKKRLQRIGRGVVRRFPKTPVRDAASGFRAMSRETALRLHVFGRYSYVGVVPFVIGLALLVRSLADCFVADEYTSRLPGLLGGLGSVLVAIQIWAVAFLAEFQATNRRVVSAIRLDQRRAQLDRLRSADVGTADRRSDDGWEQSA